jgi:hypothetical protein
MTDSELLSKLADLSKYNQKAAFVLAQITDDDVYGAVTELRRRCADRVSSTLVRETSYTDGDGHRLSATTCEIDSERWRAYFYNRRMRLAEVGPLVGLCRNWAHVIASKKRASYRTLDRIAVELAVETDEFIWAVGSDRERKRVGLLK